ncbi:MAG: protein kinase domain-containing protein [Bdellovibrionia bacterium]
MVRFFAQQLRLFAILLLAAALPVFAQDTSKILGRIYDGDKVIARVVHIGDPIGWGGVGKILRVTILNSRGEPDTFAMKVFKTELPEGTRQKILSRWSRMPQVFEQDTDGVLAYSKTGLKLVMENAKDQPAPDVMLSEIASGSALDRIPQIELKPGDPQLEAKLGVLTKFKRQTLKGIELLTANGLTHGDVKPSNVLFTTKPGFDWTHPNTAKIEFRLADFDTLTPIHQNLIIVDPLFSAPETWLKKTRKATPAYDVYSHAVGIYTMAFNNSPFYDYISSPEGAPLREEAWNAMPDKSLFQSHGRDLIKENLFSDPKRYERYLQWIDKRFRSLEHPGMSQAAQAKLTELRSFVQNGLKLSPEDRLRSFPSLRSKAMISDCPQLLEHLRALLHQ